MYGFCITMNGKVAHECNDVIHYKNILCENYMIKKFGKDKVFTETKDFIILLDGIILNSKSLTGGGNLSLPETLIRLYQEKGEIFFSELRGSFAGAIYNKSEDSWIIFGDQIGSRFIYYSQVGDFFCCSEVMGHMYKMLNDNGLKYHLNTTGALLLLTYGFMVDDCTLCEEVKKINPGCYIKLKDGRVEEHRYYLLDNTPEAMDEKEAIEKIDIEFRQAVKREFEKDEEYGYRHMVALSGGLDSRMTTFVAHAMGYTDQLNYTFSQTGYWDDLIAQQITAFLMHEWIFKALDNGVWLLDADNVSRFTGGNVLYYHIAHSDSIFKYLSFNGLGLVHTGQLGDVILGSCIKPSEVNTPYQIGEGAYSKKYVDKIQDFQSNYEYPNKEIGRFYWRFFNGTNNGIQGFYNQTETLSPFLDLDFMELCMHIPVELRQNHHIYKKWILSKYPDAAKFEWEKTESKLSAHTIRIGERELPIRKIPKSIKAHIRVALGIKESANNIHGMHPMAYYIAHNEILSSYIDKYFQLTDAIEEPELRKIILEIKDQGTAMEKIQAMSLLSAVKVFYI